jgi:peptidoglycan/LPS O-acetylase OafA/YrhL
MSKRSPLRWLAPVGNWSYSLYLIHPVVIAAGVVFLHGASHAVSAIVFVTGSLVVAYAMFHGVEKRVMKPKLATVVERLF